MNWPDGTIVRAGGVLWFICTYRHGIRRAVPADYGDGRVIMIMTEFSEAYPDAVVIWFAATPGSMMNVRQTGMALGIHENTVRNWVKDGRLKPAGQLNVRGWMRFDPAEVERARQLNLRRR